MTTTCCPWLVWEAVRRRAQVITQDQSSVPAKLENPREEASTQELIQSWLSFSVRSVLGPGVFPFGGESTGPVRRGRGRLTVGGWDRGALVFHFKTGIPSTNSVQPTQPAGQGSRRGRHVPAPFGGTSGAGSPTEQETARAPTRELEGTEVFARVLGLRVVVRAATSVLAL